LPCVSARLSHVSANENSGYYAKTITGKYGYGLFTVSDKEIKVIVKDIQNKMLDEFVIGK
jgi:ribosomal protein L25 (general stress protein Ctc)